MIEQIKQALEQATQGPWYSAESGIKGKYYFSSINQGAVDPTKENCHLIANAPEWLRWQNERIEQLEKTLEMNIEFATLELDYEGSLRILRQIADFSRTALGKEEYPMNKHNTMVYEVNISNGTRWISADIDQILMDLKDLFNKGETAEITCWYSGVPASIMNWKSSEKSGKGGTQ